MDALEHISYIRLSTMSTHTYVCICTRKWKGKREHTFCLPFTFLYNTFIMLIMCSSTTTTALALHCHGMLLTRLKSEVEFHNSTNITYNTNRKKLSLSQRLALAMLPSLFSFCWWYKRSRSGKRGKNEPWDERTQNEKVMMTLLNYYFEEKGKVHNVPLACH